MSFQIETKRLIIRDVRDEDIPILLEQSVEPESRSGILSCQADETYNKRKLENAIGWAKHPHFRREEYNFSVALKAGGDLIGTCGIYNVRPGCVETIVGWHYGYKFRGRGYATEATRALLHFGFEIKKVKEIYADCFADNQASIRVIEKIGMSSHPNLILFDQIRGWSYGENRPAARYVITREQWLARAK